MPYKLTQNLETGNKIIDSEHRELFQIANQLLDACDKDAFKASLRPAVEFLLDHVTTHFAHEEQLLEQIGYPRIKEHKAFHEQYQKDLRRILLQIPAAGPTLTDVININGQISSLVNHVKTDDRNICEYIHPSKK